MRSRLLGLAALAISAHAAQAATETVLYSFTGGADGASPNGGLVADSAGNLYGTTAEGGKAETGCGFGTSQKSGCGVVFKLHPNGDGSYTETVLHAFQGGYYDAQVPEAGLVMDATGNLYGTTPTGGNGNCPGPGCGTVFSIAPDGNVTIIHSFQGRDGALPYCTLVLDSAGNLYGVTLKGGYPNLSKQPEVGNGVFFELSPQPSTGGWSYTVRHDFNNPSSVVQPIQIALSSKGVFYGVGVAEQVPGVYSPAPTPDGVFLINPSNSSGGQWSGRTLLTGEQAPSELKDFYGQPYIGVDGAIYGTTETGTAASTMHGAVFRLAPTQGTGGRGPWTVSILHDFAVDGPHGNVTHDGLNPMGGVIGDAAGNLFGTTANGGYHPGKFFASGTVFELVRKDSNHYEEQTLWNFLGHPDGAYPVGSLINDSNGNLYGVTAKGGSFGLGTVYRITP